MVNSTMQTKKIDGPTPTKITIVTAPIQLLVAGVKVMQQAADKQKQSETEASWFSHFLLKAFVSRVIRRT